MYHTMVYVDIYVLLLNRSLHLPETQHLKPTTPKSLKTFPAIWNFRPLQFYFEKAVPLVQYFAKTTFAGELNETFPYEA